MRKELKRKVCAILAGLMVFQSAPGIIAGAAEAATQLDGVVETKSRIVSGRTATSGSGSLASSSVASLSNMVLSIDMPEEMIWSNVGGKDTLSVTATIKTAPDSDWDKLVKGVKADDIFVVELESDLDDEDVVVFGTPTLVLDGHTLKASVTVGNCDSLTEGVYEDIASMTIFLKAERTISDSTFIDLIINHDLINDVTISITSELLYIQRHEKYDLIGEGEIWASPSNAPLYANFYSSNPTVASVDGAGVITANSYGEAVITAYVVGYDGVSDSVRVIVPEMYIDLDDDIYLEKDDTFNLSAYVASAADAEYRSSDDKVASVDANGLITANHAGETWIFVTYGDGDPEHYDYVRVEVKGVTIDPENLEWWAEPSEVYTITAKYWGKYGAGESFSWRLNDRRIAEFTEDPDEYDYEDGYVQVRCNIRQTGSGTVNVTATFRGYTETCKVTIMPTIKFFCEEEIYLYKGSSFDITKYMTASPADAKMIFTSENPDAVAVDSNGIITAGEKASEPVKITVSLEGYSLSNSIWVSVYEKGLGVYDPVLVLNEDDDATKYIYAEFFGEFDDEQKIAWTIEDPTVIEATDHKDGYCGRAEYKGLWSEYGVKPLKAGTTKVTAELDGMTETCMVKVLPKGTEDKTINALTNLLGAARNLDEAERTEKIEIVNTITTDVKNMNLTEDDMDDDTVIGLIDSIEALMVEGGVYDEPVVSDDANLGFDLPTGLVLSLNPETDRSVSLKTSIVPADTVTVPSGVRKAVAIDIKVVADQIDGGTREVTSFRVPIMLEADVPDSLVRIARAGRLVVRHFHNSTTDSTEIIPAVSEDGTRMRFGVQNFSTFVVGESYTTGGSGSSGGGGGSSSGVTSGSSANLSGEWVKDATGWWFKQTSGGYPANSWGKINNKWYYFNAQGYMMTGWVTVAGKWYYLQSEGDMVASNWVSYNGNWYYLNADGSMAVSTTTPDGYTVNAEGIWVQ